jgi:arabinogalactan oligomer/maltooligosaccharide transport system permease protein
LDIKYYKLSWHKKIIYKISKLLKDIGKGFIDFWRLLIRKTISIILGTGNVIKLFFINFIDGSLITKLSYLFIGIGHLFRGQIFRGIVYLLSEFLFIAYLVFFGGNYLGMFFKNIISCGNIGNVETSENIWNEELGIYDKVLGDNSFHIILYPYQKYRQIIQILMREKR